MPARLASPHPSGLVACNRLHGNYAGDGNNFLLASRATFPGRNHKSMKNRRFLAFAVLALVATIATGTPASPSPLNAMQSLGVQLKTAADRARGGKQPESKSLADFERTLIQLRGAVAGDPQLQRKYQAITLLFANLKHQAADPASAPAKPVRAMRAQLDVEVVTERHGGECANALGISEALPARITLGQAGHGRSEAWFRFEPRATGNFRITTDSEGADPVLEVFNGCGPGAQKVAANDDAIGLDATVALSMQTHTPVYVRLTNSGAGGRILASVANVTSAITGFVKDASTGLALADIGILLLDSTGSYTGSSVTTDAGGNYSIPVANAGTYYLRANAGYTYVPEVYPTALCVPGTWYQSNSCDLAHAQTISVAAGSTITNINFSLSAGQQIAGQVRDMANHPLNGAYVQLFDASNNALDWQYADQYGRYAFPALPPRNYKVEAKVTYSGYGAQMFNHIDCSGPMQNVCDLNQASSIVLASQDVTNVNFALPQLAAIQGTISPAISASPPPLYFPEVEVLDMNGNFVTSATPDSNGHYLAGPLVRGSYYVQASAGGYFPQIFQGIDCASDCVPERASATQVTLAADGQQAVADFDLHPLPAVHGHVQDASSGQPLANVSVGAYQQPFGSSWFPVSSAVTDINGDYTLTGTPLGQFYVWALSDDHIDQIYPGGACEAYFNGFQSFTTSCDLANATLLTIALGQTPGPFDFNLNASSSISGHALTKADPGADLPADYASVAVYDGHGTTLAQAAVDLFGNYAITDLESGSYYAEAPAPGIASWPVYGPQLWQHIDCALSCNPTTGTPILLAPGATATGIDFDLTRLDAIVGRVTNTNGKPVTGVLIDLFDSGTGVYQGFSSVVDSQGYFVSPGNLDRGYFVATEAGDGYIDQIYSGVACPLGAAYFGNCPFTNATPVTLGSGATQPHIVNFVLQSSDPIFANGFE